MTMTAHTLPTRFKTHWLNWQQQRLMLRQDWRTVRFLALDLETNGLDCGADGILSMAWVPIHNGVMGMSEARYHVIQTPVALNQSVVHHHLTSADIADGETLDSVMRQLAQAMSGAVLVAHHAGLDWRLLRAASKQTGVELSPLAVVDTLLLERRRRAQRYQHEQMGAERLDAYTLSACRQRHGLPPRAAHHALEDAVACGELFLAQAWKQAGNAHLPAADLVRRSRPTF
ncbi:MAG: 3'-5' exonuclease [Natronospirillum sp.]|uniref:3'-5' exonuclease n=1 Tax=Natronospirillum sp. TaxID=2812955 RepID=UPI0025DF475B|nr:3'-5' exonuclease [Natronospirillum sp.]MCH8550984.1 3'-5' exonuclease [Natronospirillum sp.]